MSAMGGPGRLWWASSVLTIFALLLTSGLLANWANEQNYADLLKQLQPK